MKPCKPDGRTQLHHALVEVGAWCESAASETPLLVPGSHGLPPVGLGRSLPQHECTSRLHSVL